MRKTVQRISTAAGTALTFALCFMGAPPSACGQGAEPLHTIIAVHLDVTSGDITVGSTVYKGVNSGMHLLALSRKPDSKHLDAPDLINDATVHDESAANQFLEDVLANDAGAFLIVNAVGNYGFVLSAIAANLEKFGAAPDIQGVTGAIPFVFLGNGGRSEGQANQARYPTRNVDGYLATDSNGNYAFIQTDYVRYDMTPQDGTIKIGGTTYTVAGSNRPSGCDGSNGFHLVVVNREDPSAVIANNSYCTAQSDSEITRFWTDIEHLLSNEGYLFFITSNGHAIPANWDFYNCTNPPATCQGADGDRRIQRLGNDIAKLGGYFETMIYLTPKDTYSLVGAAAPPAGTPEAANRARESSTVYPDHPTGELHGELGRGLRGNWYSPLDADPTGNANLEFYQILAKAPVPFPHPCAPTANGCNPQEYLAELAAFQSISNQLCDGCNVRNNYPNRSIQISSYLTRLSVMFDPNTNQPCPNKPASAFCIVRQQLLNEFTDVVNIRAFDDNLTTLWATEGTTSIFALLKVSNTLLANMPPPNQPTAPNLVEPIVSFFLGLASEIPEVGEVAGVAETAFRFATNLTTDENGDEQLSSYIETSSTLENAIAALADNANTQFHDQGKTTGTQFDFIYQDWGKINTLGTALASGSPGWIWGSGYTAAILTAMTPAIEASYYQSLMAAEFAIGSYVPGCGGCQWPNNAWGTKPIYLQPSSYTVDDPDYQHGGPGLNKVYPFWTAYKPPNYYPYTFPTDADNIYNPDMPSEHATQNTNTLLASGSWLAISWQKSPPNGGANGLYDPPAESILTHLFTPVSEKGLGVYRPAFFEGWPFPRVKCDQSQNSGAIPGNGCPWGSAAPSPDAVPAPFTSVSIGPGTSNEKLAGKDQIQVPLTIVNNGTLEAQSLQIDQVSLCTLAGSGEAVLADPLLPIKLGNLAPGDTTTLNLVITLPSSVKQLAVTERGTASNNEGAPPAQFSYQQTVVPDKQQ